MSLSSKDVVILQEIISVDGKCLYSKRCLECPFRAMCLPEFLNPKPLTQPQRLRMALDVLSHHSIMDDNDPMSGVKSSHEIKNTET